jgi:type II secretory pathway pseudopilin PulG
MHKSKKKSAFTLVELMIIVAILADVLIVAMPAFMRARNMAQNTKFITDLRTASAAFEMYAAENNHYPAASAPGIIPSGMSVYLNGVPWSSGTPIGGRWAWLPNQFSVTAQLGVVYGGGSPGIADDVRMADIDSRIDNSALSTGAFRQQDANTFVHIIE